MFIIDLNYLVPLAEIDAHMAAHMKYLNKHYEAGNFITSGRKIPRTGGIIICRGSGKDEVMSWVEKDPFVKLKLASYTITEFNNSQTHPELEGLL